MFSWLNPIKLNNKTGKLNIMTTKILKIKVKEKQFTIQNIIRHQTISKIAVE